MYRRKYFIAGGVFIGLLVAAGIITTVLHYNKTITKLQETITEQDELIATYESSMSEVYQVVADVKAGNTIETSQIQPVLVQNDAIPENAIVSEDQLADMMYKIDISANSIITEDMIMEQVLKDDLRELDVILAEIPIGLEIGDYIDVRVSFPLGQDYIAMTKKRVVAINGNAVKLIVGEDDFYTYESMKTDIAIYASTKAYGTTYVEAGIQKDAVVYYPVNLDVMKTRLLDPNIDTKDFSDSLALREQLEEQLMDGYLSDKVEIQEKVTSTKSQIEQQFKEAEQAYEILQEQKEEAALYSNEDYEE